MKARFLHNLIAVAVMIAAVIIAIFSGAGTTYAATIDTEETPSSVLEDLQKDGSFNAEDYPIVGGSRSLHVIQIAESTAGELLIYVYQPGGKVVDVRASSINIAREADNSAGLGFINYPLVYVDSSDVFYKYRVKDFELRADAVRYYNISNILRPYIRGVDKPPADGGSISEVPNTVGQFWTVCTVNGNISYSMTYSEVVEIKNKVVGFLDYCDGVSVDVLTVTVTGSHTLRNFVAFSSDYDIDRLIDVDIEYCVQGLTFKQCCNPICMQHKLYATYDYVKTDNKTTEKKTLYADGKSSNNYNGGMYGNKYTWNDIQTTEEFRSENNNENYVLKIENGASLDGTQWVLNFYNVVSDMKNSVILSGGHSTINTQNVSNVMILRLKFERDGKTFNLGAVDNKQTGSGEPWNEPAKSDELPWWFWVVVGLAAVVAVIIIAVVLSFLFPPLFKVFKGFFKCLWLIVSAPFRFIAFIVRKISERKEAAPAKAATSKSSKTKTPKRSKSKPRTSTHRSSTRTGRTRKAHTGSKRK